MLALAWLGGPVERYIGSLRYLGLYVVSGLAGSAGALVANPTTLTVGASGAVFGILGALLIIEYQQTGSVTGQAFTLILINLAFSFTVAGISIGGHIGGLIGGVLATLAISRFGRATSRTAGSASSVRRAAGCRRAERRRRVLESTRVRLRGDANPRDRRYNVRVKRFAVAVLCALVVVPAAGARPLLGILGNAERFASLTGQQSTVGHVIIGWGQGAGWGSPFANIFSTLGEIPMIGLNTDTGGREAITPAQIAAGKGDDYLVALNAAIAAFGQPIYIAPSAR